MAVAKDAVDTAIGMLADHGINCTQVGFFRQGRHSVLRRDGKETRWEGTDPERFTEMSWNNGQLADYLSSLTSNSAIVSPALSAGAGAGRRDRT